MEQFERERHFKATLEPGTSPAPVARIDIEDVNIGAIRVQAVDSTKKDDACSLVASRQKCGSVPAPV